MLKRIVIALAIFALAASAGSVPAKVTSFTVNLMQKATIQGQELKAGEYRVTINGEKASFLKGKQAVEVPVKVETVEQKFDNTAVRYTGTEKVTITEIRVGGSKTKLLFN
jgi:hypothetical protein